MKVLLVGVNAKFVQTNLAVRLLRSYVLCHSSAVRSGTAEIAVAEWNINQPVQTAVRGVVESGADVVAFSTYIWNRSFVLRACAELRLVLPDALIGLGGPEVSWSAERTLTECPAADFVVAGEGEATMAELVDRLAEGTLAGRTVGARAGVRAGGLAGTLAGALSGLRGVYARSGGTVVFGGEREPIADLGEIPFPYAKELMDFDPTNRIVYYESSRGCPFSCAYCLSSIDRSVRYYPLERVLSDIDCFLEGQFPLVKFTDRTFNLSPARYLAIWEYIRDHYNGTTRFHFELSADLLSDDAFAVLATMPEGSVQFEIGIQSANPETLRLVGRKSDIDTLAANIRRIPAAIHRHVDLIAGLPAEDLSSFARSFDFAFSLGADMLQLGFLKILDGSPMAAIARAEAGPAGYAWSPEPPYEVLRSPAMPYRDLLVVKDVECLVDAWYNSGLLCNFLMNLVTSALGSPVAPGESGPGFSAFCLFVELAAFVRSYFADGDLYLPRRPADVFACAHAFHATRLADGARRQTSSGNAGEWLRYDFLLQGKPGAFPAWYERRYSREAHDAALSSIGLLDRHDRPDRPGLAESRRTLYARTEYDRFVLSPDEGEIAVLFEYSGEKKGEKKAICRRV